MTLDEYLTKHGHGEADLAARANTSAASINRIRHGEQTPSAEMMRSIVEATKGIVTADDLLFGAPRQRKAKAA
jgi:transcriptional regulator with XRE-family HTH domain